MKWTGAFCTMDIRKNGLAHSPKMDWRIRALFYLLCFLYYANDFQGYQGYQKSQNYQEHQGYKIFFFLASSFQYGSFSFLFISLSFQMILTGSRRQLAGRVCFSGRTQLQGSLWHCKRPYLHNQKLHHCSTHSCFSNEAVRRETYQDSRIIYLGNRIIRKCI